MLMDIFNNAAFRAVEVTAAFEQVQYVPGLLGAYGEALFPTRRSRTRDIAVYRRDGRFALIPVSPIGAPPVELETAGANMRLFRTKRIAKGTTVFAEELQGVLLAPEGEQLATVQGEIAERAIEIRRDIELTHEHMRFGALFGKVMDADGVTVIDDWYANWGVAEMAPIDLALDVATTNIRLAAKNIIDTMMERSKGGWVRGRTQVHALCGSTFYDLLITHPNVEKFYMNWAAAADLRGRIEDEFEFGGIIWHNFRGSDDGTTMTINPNTCRFFPVGGSNIFQRVLGPAEFIEFINQPGREIVGRIIPDRDRNASIREEMYSYPLYVCLRPDMLFSGTV